MFENQSEASEKIFQTNLFPSVSLWERLLVRGLKYCIANCFTQTLLHFSPVINSRTYADYRVFPCTLIHTNTHSAAWREKRNSHTKTQHVISLHKKWYWCFLYPVLIKCWKEFQNVCCVQAFPILFYCRIFVCGGLCVCLESFWFYGKSWGGKSRVNRRWVMEKYVLPDALIIT